MGAANEVVGETMRGIGEVLGSDKPKHKGVVQEAKGDAQLTMGKVKDAAGPPVQH